MEMMNCRLGRQRVLIFSSLTVLLVVCCLFMAKMLTSEGSDDEDNAAHRKPAWVDDEEEKMTINIAKVNRLRKLRKEEDETLITGSEYVSRLRAQHVKLNPGTDWAQLDSNSGMDRSFDDKSADEEIELAGSHGYKEVDEILRTNEDLVVKSSTKLLLGLLEYSRLVDANA